MAKRRAVFHLRLHDALLQQAVSPGADAELFPEQAVEMTHVAETAL